MENANTREKKETRNLTEFPQDYVEMCSSVYAIVFYLNTIASLINKKPRIEIAHRQMWFPWILQLRYLFSFKKFV